MFTSRFDFDQFLPDDPSRIPEARELFNRLREKGDGRQLAAHLLDTECQLQQLFLLKFEQAFWFRLNCHDLLHTDSLHEWIEERAKRTIRSRVERTCCDSYEDRNDDSFAGYLYRFADRNISYACLSARSRLKKTPAPVDDLNDLLSQQEVRGAVSMRDYLRALRIAIPVVKQMPEPQRTIMQRALRGETIERIADSLGMYRREVQSLYDEGIQKTRDAWDQDDFDPASG